MKSKQLLTQLLMKEFSTTAELEQIVANPSATISELRKSGFKITAVNGLGYNLDNSSIDEAILYILGEDFKLVARASFRMLSKIFIQKINEKFGKF